MRTCETVSVQLSFAEKLVRVITPHVAALDVSQIWSHAPFVPIINSFSPKTFSIKESFQLARANMVESRPRNLPAESSVTPTGLELLSLNDLFMKGTKKTLNYA